MKLEIKTAKSTQTGIPELNKPETILHYLIIGEGDDKVIINIGEKTYNKIKKITKEK